jgi:hypothetical protein
MCAESRFPNPLLTFSTDPTLTILKKTHPLLPTHPYLYDPTLPITFIHFVPDVRHVTIQALPPSQKE